MIERLRIQNFKVFRDVEFPLQPLTVIVGPNASGKSSILQALEWMAWLVFPEGRQEPPAKTFWRAAEVPFVLSPQVKAEGKVYSWRMSGAGEPLRLVDSQPAVEATPSLVSDSFRGRRLAFETLKLAAPSYFHPEQLPARLSDSGSGLASVIANLQLEEPKKFKQLVEQLRAVVPIVEEVRTRFATATLLEPDEDRVDGALKLRKYSGVEILVDFIGTKGISASQVSEGTLLTLGLMLVLNGLNPPNLLLIDDVERGLHPRALGDLILQLRRLQAERPELQIVASSHSPLLLDYLKPEEVLLTALNLDGSASVAPLTAHPDFERWRDVMEPGEFWSTVGEKWIIEQEEAAKP